MSPITHSHEESKIIMADGSNSPIFYKEQTVGHDDKLYDVMVLIKPKNATISVVDNKADLIDGS